MGRCVSLKIQYGRRRRPARRGHRGYTNTMHPCIGNDLSNLDLELCAVSVEVTRIRSSTTHQVRVPCILDRHHSDPEQTSGSGSKVDVGAVVVVDRGFGAARMSARKSRDILWTSRRKQRGGTDTLTAWRSIRFQTFGGEGSSWR